MQKFEMHTTVTRFLNYVDLFTNSYADIIKVMYAVYLGGIDNN